MEIKDYPGNSKSTAKPKKEIKPVVEGNVGVKKKSEIAKMKDKVIQEDLPKVKNHIIFDIMIPKLKQILADSFNTLLFGEGSIDRERDRVGKPRVSYRKYYDEPRTRERPTTATTNRYGDYDDIWFETRTEAFRVLETMKDIMREYGEVSISDMYDLAGITCPHTYTRFGWVINTPSDLSDARVVPDGPSYVIKLPRPMQID